jgi:hypothetical protein
MIFEHYQYPNFSFEKWTLHDNVLLRAKGFYWLCWNHHFKLYDHHHDLILVITFRSFPHIWLITGCGAKCRGRTAYLLEHPNSPPVLLGVRVTRSLVLRVCFVDRCLSFFFWASFCLFFCVVFCGSLCLSVHYSNGILKLFVLD